MDFIIDFSVSILTTSSEFIRPYLSEIGLSLVATLLVIYGNNITGLIKRQIGSLSYVLRVSLFIVFCAVGFGFLTSFLTPLIIGLLAGVSDIWLALLVLASYYLAGYLAYRKGFI